MIAFIQYRLTFVGSFCWQVGEDELGWVLLLGRLLLDGKFEGVDVGSSEAFNFALRRSSWSVHSVEGWIEVLGLMLELGPVDGCITGLELDKEEGDWEGIELGFIVSVGVWEGWNDGSALVDGCTEGWLDGLEDEEGDWEGIKLGLIVSVGVWEGCDEGLALVDGTVIGIELGADDELGSIVGNDEGSALVDGLLEGSKDGCVLKVGESEGYYIEIGRESLLDDGMSWNDFSDIWYEHSLDYQNR